MPFIELIIGTLWLILPAGLANMTPPLARKLNLLAYPVDGGLKFKGKPLFGSHKTVRGFVVGTLASIITLFIQVLLSPITKSIELINYSDINILLLGFLFGFGALFGDLIESFFKRRVNIKSGKPWVPFDQIDWIIGALALAALYITISWQIFLTALILFGFLHPLINYIGYLLKLKKNKF